MYDRAVIDRFVFEGREAIVVHPTAPANGRWIWKAEYFEAFPNFEEAMIDKGYHLCYVEHPTRWAPDSEVEVSAAFLRHVAATYRLESRGIAVGIWWSTSHCSSVSRIMHRGVNFSFGKCARNCSILAANS